MGQVRPRNGQGTSWLIGYGWPRRGQWLHFVGTYWGQWWPTRTSPQSKFKKKKKEKQKRGKKTKEESTSLLSQFTLFQKLGLPLFHSLSPLFHSLSSLGHHQPIANLPCNTGDCGPEVRLCVQCAGVWRRRKPTSAAAPRVPKVFKAYMRLWKHQQENRAKLVECGLKQWELDEITSWIQQLYFGQYLRSSECRFLVKAYVFYEAILSRRYFQGFEPNAWCFILFAVLDIELTCL